MRLSRAVLLASALAMALVSCSSSGLPSARSVPHLTDPTATGHRLVDRFFVLIEHKDVAGLRTFLSPAFQVQRADGSASNKTEYFSNLPTLKKFSISHLTATQDGAVLVVRYLATTEGIVNGKRYTPGPAPRLSVFAWTGRAWRLAAHANFNPLKG